MTKSWYESRTLWLAVAQGVAGVLVALFSVNPTLETIGWIAAVKSIVDGYLRITTKIQ